MANVFQSAAGWFKKQAQAFMGELTIAANARLIDDTMRKHDEIVTEVDRVQDAERGELRAMKLHGLYYLYEDPDNAKGSLNSQLEKSNTDTQNARDNISRNRSENSLGARLARLITGRSDPGVQQREAEQSERFSNQYGFGPEQKAELTQLRLQISDLTRFRRRMDKLNSVQFAEIETQQPQRVTSTEDLNYKPQRADVFDKHIDVGEEIIGTDPKIMTTSNEYVQPQQATSEQLRHHAITTNTIDTGTEIKSDEKSVSHENTDAPEKSVQDEKKAEAMTFDELAKDSGFSVSQPKTAAPVKQEKQLSAPSLKGPGK